MRNFVIGFALAVSLALGVAVAEGPSGTPQTPKPTYAPYTWEIANGVTVTCASPCIDAWSHPWIAGDLNCDYATDARDVLTELKILAGLLAQSDHNSCNWAAPNTLNSIVHVFP